MRTATPAVTVYVRTARPRRHAMMGRRKSGAIGRSLNYSTSPLLASQTPPWRSKLLVALVGLGFCVLIGRAATSRSSAAVLPGAGRDALRP